MLTYFQNIKKSYHGGELHSAEAVALTLLTHILNKNPKTWRQGQRGTSKPHQNVNFKTNLNLTDKLNNNFIKNECEENQCEENFCVENHWHQLLEDYNQPQSFKNELFWEFIKKYRIKGLSERIIQALVSWRFEGWDLVLYERVLDPIEVLELQCRGQRCVSVFWDPDTYNSHILKGKDSFEFTVHDLEHAERFYFNEEIKQGQIEFYKKLNEQLKEGLWNSYLKDHQFKEDFDYLLSDMNTHPEHQRQYLQAIIYKHNKNFL